MQRTRLIAIVLLIGACKSTGKSMPMTLVADAEAKNVAVLFGTVEDLKGTSHDVADLASFLRTHFAVTSYEYYNQDANGITRLAQKHALEVGDKGTFLFFFTGHGGKSGDLVAANQTTFKINSVLQKIASVRKSPFKRLIVISDSCFSGNMVNGDGSITQQQLGTIPAPAKPDELDKFRLDNSEYQRWNHMSGSIWSSNLPEWARLEIQQYQQGQHESLFKDGESYLQKRGMLQLGNTGLYEQLLVVTASQADQTSIDTIIGGIFTRTFISSASVYSSRPDATIKTILDDVASSVESTGGFKPVYRDEPRGEVLGDTFFGETKINAREALHYCALVKVNTLEIPYCEAVRVGSTCQLGYGIGGQEPTVLADFSSGPDCDTLKTKPLSAWRNYNIYPEHFMDDIARRVEQAQKSKPNPHKGKSRLVCACPPTGRKSAFIVPQTYSIEECRKRSIDACSAMEKSKFDCAVTPTAFCELIN